MTEHLELLCAIDVPLGRSFHVGKGIALCVQGWAFCPGKIIKRLYVLEGGRRHKVHNHSWLRPDVVDYLYPVKDADGESLFSGYNVVLPMEEITEKENREIFLCAELKSGEIVQQSLGVIELLPGSNRRPEKAEWPASGPKVAICMATYNPSRKLLQRQIESIIEQDHSNWICIITDDSTNPVCRHDILDLIEHDRRFIYVINQERKGFYGNFEECLSLVPADADFIALADQDDHWDKDKLSALLSSIKGEHKLVFSDCRIVSGDKIVSVTFWNTRENHYRDFESMFIANVVTGAASLFRADLLEYVLPFPQKLSDVYHDQWIALVADLKGGISYIDRPLYSYNQHADNVIGHRVGGPFGGLGNSVRQLFNNVKNKRRLLETARHLSHQASSAFPDLLQKAILGATLTLRVRNAPATKQKVLKQLSTIATRLSGPALLKLAAMARNRKSTLNVEGYLLNFYFPQ
ncbi:glycosyltransferase involved in cell wall biosynthesis [Bradyrhizobium sp. GM6.1]